MQDSSLDLVGLQQDGWKLLLNVPIEDSDAREGQLPESGTAGRGGASTLHSQTLPDAICSVKAAFPASRLNLFSQREDGDGSSGRTF